MTLNSCTGIWSTNMRARAKICSDYYGSKRSNNDVSDIENENREKIYRKILIKKFQCSNIRLIFLILASVLNFQHSGCDESTNDFQKISKFTNSNFSLFCCSREIAHDAFFHDSNFQITHGFTKNFLVSFLSSSFSSALPSLLVYFVIIPNNFLLLTLLFIHSSSNENNMGHPE